MDMGFNYVSVCSGIEAASVAWEPLGWRPWGFAEIEPFPSAVLAARWPGVPNLGDMTKFARWPDADFSLLVGGTPCQSFSVAGLRGGLADPRGNLALVYLAIADRYCPRWLVWENVPGVLSSNGGRDFGALIGAMVELGYGACWRVLDAQYVRVDGFERAVPQQRRRVFVVGYLGDWRRAAAVLFEPESLRGYSPPRREAGKGFAADVVPCIAASRRGFERTGETRGQDPVVAVALRGRDGGGTAEIMEGVSHAIRASQGGGDKPHVLTEVVRRLTPRECERLQGFPDDYTLIRWRGKDAPDGPRYKALGNSMAVNVMRWLGRRISLIDSDISE